MQKYIHLKFSLKKLQNIPQKTTQIYTDFYALQKISQILAEFFAIAKISAKVFANFCAYICGNLYIAKNDVMHKLPHKFAQKFTKIKAKTISISYMYCVGHQQVEKLSYYLCCGWVLLVWWVCVVDG